MSEDFDRPQGRRLRPGSGPCATGSSRPSRIWRTRAAAGAAPVRFEVTPTTREDGGGGIMSVLRGGRVFEKVGVNWSAVHGTLGERAQKAMAARGVPGMAERPAVLGQRHFSLVAHMVNPHTPAVHMNTRMFWTPGAWWFGGGADLNPCIEYPGGYRAFPCRDASGPAMRMTPTTTPGSRPGRMSISLCRTGVGRAAWAGSSMMT